MSEHDQTPLQKAISFLTIASILVGVACYAAALRNIPIASPALFWVASLIYHWVPELDAINAPQMPMLVSACNGWRRFPRCGGALRGLVSQVFLKRSDRQFGAANGEAPAQSGSNSKATLKRVELLQV